MHLHCKVVPLWCRWWGVLLHFSTAWAGGLVCRLVCSRSHDRYFNLEDPFFIIMAVSILAQAIGTYLGAANINFLGCRFGREVRDAHFVRKC